MMVAMLADTFQFTDETLVHVGWIMLGILFIGFLAVAVVAEERRKAARTREREQSRREIAAYVAEGSITPDDAVRLMAAGASLKDKLTE